MLDRVGVASILLLSLLTACEPSRGEVRTWQPEDHDNAEPNPLQTAQPARAAPKPKQATEDRAERVWMSTCSRCHGPTGLGDGPNGKSSGAPDLTRDEWLGSVTDAQMIATIRDGKGQMPANPNMPESTLKMLVARIRNKGR